jgi:YgiT-type zinc finger domain-containing protein
VEQRSQGTQVMICLICRQTELVDRVTTVTFERGEMRLLVTDVPARICASCGEAYVEEHVAVTLLRHAEETTKAGTLEAVIEYTQV